VGNSNLQLICGSIPDFSDVEKEGDLVTTGKYSRGLV